MYFCPLAMTGAYFGSFVSDERCNRDRGVVALVVLDFDNRAVGIRLGSDERRIALDGRLVGVGDAAGIFQNGAQRQRRETDRVEDGAVRSLLAFQIFDPGVNGLLRLRARLRVHVVGGTGGRRYQDEAGQ